jgi:signal transduction histidine kinase
MGYVAAGITTAIMVLLIVGSAGLQFWGVLQEEERDHTQDWKYLVPAALMNMLVIVFIIYLLIKNKIFGTTGIVFALILLLGGFLAETYTTSLFYNEPEVYAVYAVLIFNLLVRMSYFITLRIALGVDIAKQVEEAAKLAKIAQLEAAKKQVAALASSLGLTATVTEKKDEKKSDSGSSSGDSGDKAKQLSKRWDELLNKIRADNGGRTNIVGSSIGEAQKVINDAKKSGSFNIDSVLASAKSKIKRSDGATLLGGRRR